jgi:hypothetical protein
VIGPVVRRGDDASRGGPRVGELEQRAPAAVVEESLPIAEDERVDQEDQLVDELLGEELPHDVPAAQDHDVLRADGQDISYRQAWSTPEALFRIGTQRSNS